MDRSQPIDGEAAGSPPGGTESGGSTPDSGSGELAMAELLDQLGRDRLWLLRQLDAGRWPEWRLDLAALERELGQLLEQAGSLREPV
jgi:hypothetical protein